MSRGAGIWAALCASLVAFTLALAPGVAAGQQSFDAEETNGQRCARICGDQPCRDFVFRGFSPDSEYYGYSHMYCPGPHGEGKARFTWHIRSIKPGKGKLRSKAVGIKGKHFPNWYNIEKFRKKELPRAKTDKNSYEFEGPDDITLKAELRTEKKVAWYLAVNAGEKERFNYRGQFEEIYFNFVPTIYVSQNGQRIAVLLGLDAMVKTDSALIVFSLNP